MRKPLEGTTFGRLTVCRYVGLHRNKYSRYECRCECGAVLAVLRDSLISGRTQSCGCLNRERHTKHSMYGTPEYRAWTSMLQRCLNPKFAKYRNHGGRGITVCPEWLTDFGAFFGHVGPRPSPKHSLDRINNDGNYEPGNVRWTDACEQNSNRRNSRVFQLNGEPATGREVADSTGLTIHQVFNRARKGVRCFHV